MSTKKLISPRRNLALPDLKISSLPKRPLFKLFKVQNSVFALLSFSLRVFELFDCFDPASSLLDSRPGKDSGNC